MPVRSVSVSVYSPAKRSGTEGCIALGNNGNQSPSWPGGYSLHLQCHRPRFQSRRVSYLLVFNSQPTVTLISRRFTDIKADSPYGIEGGYQNISAAQFKKRIFLKPKTCIEITFRECTIVLSHFALKNIKKYILKT